MCGIAGWVDFGRNLSCEHETLGRMKETLINRGPDNGGVWLAAHAALGHRRLSVIDPAGGGQPMIRRHNGHTYVIVYNGELYNTENLRQSLLAKGYRFNGHSDTEVLLFAYIEWGSQSLERLDGIFAFAVWDEESGHLFLARDRLGVKPLFYTVVNQSFLFASELKALLAHPDVAPVIDAEGLAEIFVMGPSRTPGHGIFKGVNELKPGYYMTVDKNGADSEKRYWSLESRLHEHNLQKTVENVRELLLDAVQRQLVSDVPVATFLSGGLDSSALTAISAEVFKEQGRGRLHSYSVDYFENEKYFKGSRFQPNNDAPWAKLVSEKVGTKHHNVFLGIPQLAASLDEAALARDLPGMADVDSSLLLFCREVKKDVTVVLSGECADEIFGGYPWFTREDELSAETFPWIRNIDGRTKLFSPALANAVNSQEYIKERYSQALAEVPHLPGENGKDARMREMFYLNITRFMPTLLDRKDRMSMAVGLEARVPYCDHRLVEYVWNIPWAMKYYEEREKSVLRLALRGIVPDEVIDRKKSPYPKTYHPAYLKAVKERLLKILAEKDSPLHQLVDAAAVKNFAESAEASANFPWFGQLMGGPQLLAFLIQVNTWLKAYKVDISF